MGRVVSCRVHGECPLDSQGNTDTMKLFNLTLLIVSASAFDLSKLRFGLAAPPTEIEYGFCDGSPEPASIDNISVEPFPILVQNGASVTLAVQITLNEPLPEGASVSLNLVLEGIIPIKIPCLDIDGLSLGSCTYTGDHLLEAAATAGICPTYFPDGQACALPLNPGVYGGGDPLTLGPIESVPDILLPFLKGTVRAEANFLLADGSLFACGFARVAVDH